MAVVTWELGRAALLDVWTLGLAALAAAVLLKWRLNSAWLVLGGGLAGLLLRLAAELQLRPGRRTVEQREDTAPSNGDTSVR